MDCGFTSDLEDYSNDVFVEEAPDADNFILGISRIKSSIDEGRLIIPSDSLVTSELRSITKDDLADKQENAFPAINSLRHVLGSYIRNPAHLLKRYKQAPPSNPYV